MFFMDASIAGIFRCEIFESIFCDFFLISTKLVPNFFHGFLLYSKLRPNQIKISHIFLVEPSIYYYIDGVNYPPRVNRCARKEQSLLFDPYKAFDKFENRHKSDIFIRKDLFSIMRVQHVI